MHTLEFLNPRFRKDLNVTVRDGAKWSERVATGDIVNLAEVVIDPETNARSAEKIGHGQILDVHHFAAVGDIPEVYLQCAACRGSTTKLGLIESMDKAYPNGWGGDEGLTVIMFLRMR